MITMKDIQPLREACEVFLANTQDELHGDMVGECMAAGSIERIVQEGTKLIEAGKTTLPTNGDDHWDTHTTQGAD